MTDFKYDVAFSFLSVDLPLTRRLAEALESGVTTFVYTRQKEDLLGNDGMERFATVFQKEARLTVVLHRDGWGKTPWTAFEESHIRDRALHSRMTSFLVVRLDGSELPTWVPSTHLYASMSTETESDIVAVIRARARQEGATVRRATAAEYAVERQRRSEAARARADRQASSVGLDELHIQVRLLFEEVRRIVNEINVTDSTIEARFGANDEECAISNRISSTSVVWIQPSGNSLRNARLRVNTWGGAIALPTRPRTTTQGNWQGAIHFIPSIGESDEWIWTHERNLDQDPSGSNLVVISASAPEYRTLELADHLVRRHIDRTQADE